MYSISNNFLKYAWDKIHYHDVILHYAREIATECHMRRVMFYVVIPVIS
jgi:hypothetical protein